MPEVILIPSVEDNGRKRVAAYCRVSTTNEEQATSLELQIAHYTNKIMIILIGILQACIMMLNQDLNRRIEKD